MFKNFKRVLSFALTDFFRNEGTSIAAIFVLMVTTMLVTSLFFIHGMSDFLVKTVQNKIDITAYFKSDTSEEDIMKVKDEILKNSPDIKNVQYVSKEDALNDFTTKHSSNETFSKALVQVGGNPFLPSLNITTTGSTADYQQISTVLQSDQFSNFVEKVDFSEKKDTIEKIFSITSNINLFGTILGVVLFFVALLVVFNTIKLVVDSSREEINTMRIVGASSWFVRAPFILEGAIFGFISFILCFLITILLAYFVSPGFESILPGFNVFDYFMLNLLVVIAIQLGAGVGLGVISSYIVVRKYLKI